MPALDKFARMLFHLVEKSDNAKTGPIPTVYISSDTCPDACPLKNKGCYAGLGVTNIFWRRLDRGVGLTFVEFINKLKTLYRGSLWRYAVAGDLPGINNSIDVKKLRTLVEANRAAKLRGFGYSHKPVLFGQEKKEVVVSNRRAIQRANKNGFVINLSANNLEHAVKLVALNIAPVVTVLPFGTQERHLTTPAGNSVTVCPATYTPGLTCARCQLCSKARHSIVGFPAHGAGKNMVTDTFVTYAV